MPHFSLFTRLKIHFPPVFPCFFFVILSSFHLLPNAHLIFFLFILTSYNIDYFLISFPSHNKNCIIYLPHCFPFHFIFPGPLPSLLIIWKPILLSLLSLSLCICLQHFTKARCRETSKHLCFCEQELIMHILCHMNLLFVRAACSVFHPAAFLFCKCQIGFHIP